MSNGSIEQISDEQLKQFKSDADTWNSGAFDRALDDLRITRNKLLIEVREFLNDNKTRKEWESHDFDERFQPERNVIELIPGGKGLMKRISLLEGGGISFKKIYPKIAKKRV